MNIRLLPILVLSILVISCNFPKNEPTKLTILNYAKAGFQIDSIYSYHTADIQVLEALITSLNHDSLGADDYNFRFWISHGLGLYAYCIEALKLDGQLQARILEFSVKDTTAYKILKTETIALNQSDIVALDNILTKHHIDKTLQSARNGLGEQGADGGSLYFQYFTQDKLTLIPVDCTECLIDDDSENSQQILKIIYTFHEIYDLRKLSYIKEIFS